MEWRGIKVNEPRNVIMYLYNYYIDKGSFANLSKNAPSLYRRILNQKKEDNRDDITVTQYLEEKLLQYKKTSNVDANYTRHLYEHFSNHFSLTGTEVSKPLENYLKQTADEMNISVDKVKEMFDNYEIYPELTNKIINKLDIREYNNIMTVIALNLMMDMETNPNIKLEWFNDFDDYNHLRTWEPSYATFLKTRVPKYAGPITDNKNVSIKVEGSKYYGKNLKLETVPSLMNDIFYTLKGYSADKNLTPSIYYKLDRMKKATGNLNRIGLDKLDLLEELDELSMNLGYQSIKELLKEENFHFEPISSDRVNFIDNGDSFEVIIEDYDQAQVVIDPILKKYLTDMKLDQTLKVMETPYKGTTASLLVYTYEGKLDLVHRLLTKRGQLQFNDGNPLNLTAKNLLEVGS